MSEKDDSQNLDEMETNEFDAADTFIRELDPSLSDEAVAEFREGVEKRIIDLKKLQYHFSEDALLKLAYNLDEAEPANQRKILGEYAKKVVEEILPYAEDPETGGVLLDLDYPLNLDDFKDQLAELIAVVNNAYEGTANEQLDFSDFNQEEYEQFMYLADRIRKRVLQLLQQELEERDIESKVHIQGEYFGQGNIGNVFSCRINEKEMAMKCYHNKLRESDKKKTVEHLELLKEASKHSVYLMEFFGSLLLKNPHNQKWINRLDFFEIIRGSDNLFNYLDRTNQFSFEQRDDIEKVEFKDFLEEFILPLLKGVKALHEKGLVHRDLKIENIIIIPNEEGMKPSVKVGDFDMVCKNGFKDDEGIISGTPRFMSPEQCSSGFITTKSDIYSLGKMLYGLSGGVMPEKANEAMLQNVQGIDLSDMDIPQNVKNVIAKCLQLKPEDRPGIDELIQDIEKLIEEGEKIEMTIPERMDVMKVEEVFVEKPEEEEEKRVA